MNLNKKLNVWVENKLITIEQANSIKKYELAENKSQWVLYSFIFLGVLICSIGVISVISANWDKIAPSTKLFTNFAILVGLGGLTYRSYQKGSNVLFEASLLGLAFFCLASIGLISQIYHTGGEFYQAIFVWTIITSGLMLCSNKKLLPTIWCVGFGYSITMWYWVNGYTGDDRILGFLSFSLTPYFLLFISETLAPYKGFKLQIKCFDSIATTFAVIVMTILPYFSFKYSSNTTALSSFMLPIIMAICGTLSTLKRKCLSRVGKFSIVSGSLVFMMSFLLFFLANSPVNLKILSIVFYLVSSLYFIVNQKKFNFNILMLLAVLQFFSVFFEAYSGLMDTGIGLIFSGVLILLIAYASKKMSKYLYNWIERVENGSKV